MANTQHLTTPTAQLCFPALFSPQDPPDGKGEPQYNCILLFDPASFTQKDHKLWSQLRKAGLDALTEKFGSKVIKDPELPKLASGYRWPIVDAEEKADKWAGFEEGRFFLRIKSKFQPGIGLVVMKNDRPKVVATEDQSLFYPGARVRAKVGPWAYDNTSKGVKFTLENIIFLAHGERLVEEKKVEDRFDPEEDLDGFDYAAAFSADDVDGDDDGLA